MLQYIYIYIIKLRGVVDRSGANTSWSYEGNYEVSNFLSKRSFRVHQIAKSPSHSLGRNFWFVQPPSPPPSPILVYFSLDENFTLDGNCSLDFIGLIVVVQPPKG
jgi:hypothetical protein